MFPRYGSTQIILFIKYGLGEVMLKIYNNISGLYHHQFEEDFGKQQRLT